MKKGILVYPHNPSGIFNIGDYIQSIAARQFIGKADCYINREHLDEYRGEPVKIIMNGWYMHQPANWPPSEDIVPLFVAIHINKSAEKTMLSPEGVSYLKKHQPIGCRDYHTLGLLQKHGIDAYFSGCMTLTLGQTYHNRKKDNGPIYITDLSYTLKQDLGFKMKCLWTVATKYPLLKRIQARMAECGIIQSFKGVTAFYVTFQKVISDEVLLEAIYKEQEIEDNFESEDAKFEYADNLLKEYASARMVITTRIHCALPSLAMETPIVFVTDDSKGEVHNCRLDGLKQLFHTISISDNGITCNIPGINKITSSSKFSNKTDYKSLSDELIKRCEEFVG